jgi:hypothetical protein
MILSRLNEAFQKSSIKLFPGCNINKNDEVKSSNFEKASKKSSSKKAQLSFFMVVISIEMTKSNQAILKKLPEKAHKNSSIKLF